MRIGAARDQLGDRLRTRDAVAEHDDMVGELFLDASHAPFLPSAPDDVSIGRADEYEEDEDADRRDDHRFEQPGLVATGAMSP